jgi:hypothetical protein
MSAPTLTKIIRFLLVSAGLIIVLSIFWTLVDSEYTDFLTWIARHTVTGDVLIQQNSGTITFYHYIINPNNTIKTIKDSIVASAIQFGLLLTVSLVAATPGLIWKKRIYFSLIAVGITFILQVVSVIIMAKTFNSILFVIVSDLFPPIMWAIFSFRYWFITKPVLNKSDDVKLKGK